MVSLFYLEGNHALSFYLGFDKYKKRLNNPLVLIYQACDHIIMNNVLKHYGLMCNINKIYQGLITEFYHSNKIDKY